MEQSYENAEYWYKKAVENKSISKNTYISILAEFYERRNNYPEAIYWYKISAEQGYDFSQFKLVDFYKADKGVSKDEAIYWLRKLCEEANALYSDRACEELNKLKN